MNEIRPLRTYTLQSLYIKPTTSITKHDWAEFIKYKNANLYNSEQYQDGKNSPVTQANDAGESL